MKVHTLFLIRTMKSESVSDIPTRESFPDRESLTTSLLALTLRLPLQSHPVPELSREATRCPHGFASYPSLSGVG